MNIKNNAIDTPIRILHLQQCRAGFGWHGLRRGPVIARDEDHLARGARIADGRHDELDRVGPGVDVGDVVGFVHDAEDDLGAGGVFLRQLGPERDELVVGRAALADDLAVPAGVVVDLIFFV